MSSATVVEGSSSISVSWGAATHRGNVRTLNEDSMLADAPVFVVADGMGGHEGGDVASALAIAVMASLASDAVTIDRSIIVDTIARANGVIHSHSGGGERSMGTTVTGLVVAGSRRGGNVSVVNVGDSRTYRMRSGVLEQITTDHSHVQELIDAGLLTVADAVHHPQRNVVTRALGIDAVVDIDLVLTPVSVGDRFLVCSDGLSGELDEVAIGACLSGRDPQEAADALVVATLQGAARDNVTVIVVDIDDIELAADDERTDRRGAVTLVSAKSATDITDRRATEITQPTVRGALAVANDDMLISFVPSVDPVESNSAAEQSAELAELIDDVPVHAPAPEPTGDVVAAQPHDDMGGS